MKAKTRFEFPKKQNVTFKVCRASAQRFDDSWTVWKQMMFILIGKVKSGTLFRFGQWRRLYYPLNNGCFLCVCIEVFLFLRQQVPAFLLIIVTVIQKHGVFERYPQTFLSVSDQDVHTLNYSLKLPWSSSSHGRKRFAERGNNEQIMNCNKTLQCRD